MVQDTQVVGAFMSALPFYISKDCSLAECISKMERYKLSQIVITDENFAMAGIITKRQIAKFLLLNQLKRYDIQMHKIKAEELLDITKACVTAYTTTRISEIKEIMEVLKLEYVPIVKAPWNKILVGFISYGSILKAVGEVMALP